MKGKDTFFIEDNPYGELRFRGEHQKSFYNLLGEQAILMGTFSKTFSPGFRMGWIACGVDEVINKMKHYKQLVDFHTSIFSQMVVAQYLKDNDYDAHIKKITDLYKKQCDYMVYLPMVGSITSLNASVAAAILMYEVYNQRNPKK